ncbi:hypothetical protein CBR64_17220 [Cellulosimicrobium cellulans]|uniref:Uncharacterized protein n=1 Tax=Cellulosimicrobium cellulans TaxID=1710 RepID=A0A1Y0HY14_CELCE|nr:hypothetical protein CBR64_17220 [Cellulosimicrobium cellulans]
MVDATVTGAKVLPVTLAERVGGEPATARPPVTATAVGVAETMPAAARATRGDARTAAIADGPTAREGARRGAAPTAGTGARIVTGAPVTGRIVTVARGTVVTGRVATADARTSGDRGTRAVRARAPRAAGTGREAAIVPGAVTTGHPRATGVARRGRAATGTSGPRAPAKEAAGGTTGTRPTAVVTARVRATTAVAVTAAGTHRAPGPAATGRASTAVPSRATRRVRRSPTRCRSLSSTARRAAGCGP